MLKRLQRRWRSLLLGGVGILCLGLASLGFSLSLRWSLLRTLLSWEFSDIPTITTKALSQQLAQPPSVRPVLLDVREVDEYSISHLPGAHHIPPKTSMEELTKRFQAHQTIVVYCSVGYRSSILARRMKEAGFQQVSNLEGSIFQWANEGRPLEGKGQALLKVHPFDQLWGIFLKTGLHAPLPSKQSKP